MTERFEVPVPSAEAIRAYRDSQGHPGPALRAAYRIDFPAIVRAEVERALEAEATDPYFRDTAHYLRARFGDAGEPERCGVYRAAYRHTQAGVPGIRLEETAPCTLPTGHGGAHSWETKPREAHTCPTFTPEAAALLTALAEERTATALLMPFRGVVAHGPLNETSRAYYTNHQKAQQSADDAARAYLKVTEDK